MKRNLKKLTLMSKRSKRIILVLFLVVIFVALTLFFIISYQKQKEQEKQELQTMYYRQNSAFCISGEYVYISDDVDCLTYQSWDKCKSTHIVYIWTKFYYQETGNHLTLEEIEEYLSSEYEDNEKLRIQADHKEIRDYVDFMYESTWNGERGHFQMLLDRAFNFLDRQYPSQEINYATLPLEVIDEMIKYAEDNTYQMQIEEYLGSPEVTVDAVE